MAVLTISEIRLIEKGEMFTAPTDEALVAGDAVRYDNTSLNLTGANATTAGEAAAVGLVLEVDAGQVATVVGHDSLVTLGSALAALDPRDLVYLSDTDKAIEDVVGVVTTIMGVVELVRNQGTTYKALRIKREVD